MKMTLKAIRVNSGLDQEQAGKLIGVSEDTWRNYENSKTFPNVPVIQKIEEVFNVSYNEINFLPSVTVKPYEARKEAR